MKAKLKTSVLLVSLFAIMSSMTAGFAAEYSVHDDEVRSRMKELNTKVQDIQEMLEIIRDKELSMDVLDKAAVQRKNDSMAKLTDGSLTGFKLNSNGLVSTQTYDGNDGLIKLAKSIGLDNYLNTGFNIPGLPGWGNNKPDFKTIFMGQVTDMLGKMNTRGSKASKPGTTVQENYKNTMDKYKAFADPSYFSGCDSATCDIKLVQGKAELDKGRGEILAQMQKDIDNAHAAKDMLDKNAGEIGKAKTDSSTGSDKVFGDLAKNSNLSILGKSVDLGKLTGIGDLGGDSRKVIFNSANTGSIVAAEQQTTMVDTLLFARDSLEMNLDIQLKANQNSLDLIDAIEYSMRQNYDDAKALAIKNDFRTKVGNNINKTGTKYKSPWQDKYGGGLFGL